MRFSKANLFFLVLLMVLIWGYFASFQISILNYFNRIFFHTSDLKEENLTLRLENEKLKTQIDLQEKSNITWTKGLEYKPATVFSTYPFNNQRLLGIALGSEDGIKKLMPVAASPDVLLGQVVEVFPKYSLVRTIFDSEFKIPVRISWSAVDALLEGGNQPQITLISKNTAVSSGDPVYSAGIQLPYGMRIGVLGMISEKQDSFFKKAELKLSYNMNELKKVFIVINYNK